MPMHIVLFDKADWRMALYPLTLTRPVADLRVGILTIAEKWGKWLDAPFSYLTPDYLSEKYPLADHMDDIWLIRADCCPDSRLCDAVSGLAPGGALTDGDALIACRTDAASLAEVAAGMTGPYTRKPYQYPITRIRHPEDIFLNNGTQIQSDFDLLTK